MPLRTVDPNLDGNGLRVGVAAARFNDYVTDKMLAITLRRLSELGVVENDVVVVSTPGAFELPLVAHQLADRADIDAVIAIGAIIRGESDHHIHIANATSEGILRASTNSRKPVIFGVLTTDNTEQAIARIDHATGYAEAAVEMANTMRQIDEL